MVPDLRRVVGGVVPAVGMALRSPQPLVVAEIAGSIPADPTRISRVFEMDRSGSNSAQIRGVMGENVKQHGRGLRPLTEARRFARAAGGC